MKSVFRIFAIYGSTFEVEHIFLFLEAQMVPKLFGFAQHSIEESGSCTGVSDNRTFSVRKAKWSFKAVTVLSTHN